MTATEMAQTEPVLALVAVLLLLSVAASKLTRRFGVPMLLLFIGIGMLAGSEGVGGVEFTNFEVAQAVGVTALAIILFSGGLDTDARRVRPVIGPALSLATVGVGVTCAIVGAAAHVVLDVPWETGLLVGAIVSSTDAAAVFSVLRSQSIGLQGDLRPTLELESGSNDPMAVFLTIGLLTLITEPDTSIGDLVLLFSRQMLLGVVLGLVLGRVAVAVVNKARLGEEGLYPILTTGLALLIFGGTATLGGSGFLAVYLAGIVMGNRRIVHGHSILRFHDAAAWLAQIAMFLALGLLVFPSRLVDVAAEGIVIAVVLVLIARPIATFVALPTRRYTVRGRLLLAWVGLRGAVPIILATFALAEGVEGAEALFDVVFFTVLISVLVQGTTVASAARILGVGEAAPDKSPAPLAFNPVNERSNMGMHEYVIDSTSPASGRQIAEIGLPKGVLMLLISRGSTHLLPEGTTVLEHGDRLLVLAPATHLDKLRTVLDGPVADTTT